MKIKKILLALFLICISFISTAYVIRDERKRKEEYLETRSRAEREYKDKAYVSSLKDYALIAKNDIDLNLRIAEIYVQLDRQYDLEKQIERILKIDKKCEKAYELAIKYFLEKQYFDKAYSYKNKYLKSFESSINLKDILDKMQYLYERVSLNVDEIGEFFDSKKVSLIQIKKNGKWAYALKDASSYMEYKFDELGGFSDKVMAFAGRIKKDWSYYDIEGNKVKHVGHGLKYLGPYDDLIAYCDLDGKFGYMDKEFKVVEDNLEFAGPFKNGLAAIKKDGLYKIIDIKLRVVLEGIKDIKVDKFGYSNRNGFFAVTFNNKDWIILNDKQKKVGKTYEDVLFPGDTSISVKENGKYHLIDYRGNNIKSGAHALIYPLSSNLSLVVDKESKFIDKNGKTIISNFDKAKNFNDVGVSAVLKDNKWYLISLMEYKYK